jgi:hypothetical protein
MTAGKERKQDLLSHFLLPDDGLGKFLEQSRSAIAKLLDDLLFGFVG